MNQIFDSHVHSDNSSDAQHSITFLCEQAVKLGMKGICITDHCELGEYEAEQYVRRIQQSVFSATMARANFSDRLTVMTGVELSDTLFNEELTKEVIASHPFDFILVSQHCMADGTDFFFGDFKTMEDGEIDRRLRDYFQYLARVSEWGQYDSLAHLTYPLRYISVRDGRPVDVSRYDDYIEQILKNAASSGKAVEFNTSGLVSGQEGTPPARYIRRFKELGGEYITLGSDAHCAEDLGHGIPEGLGIVSRAGFKYYTVYKEREPIQFEIEL